MRLTSDVFVLATTPMKVTYGDNLYEQVNIEIVADDAIIGSAQGLVVPQYVARPGDVGPLPDSLSFVIRQLFRPQGGLYPHVAHLLGESPGGWGLVLGQIDISCDVRTWHRALLRTARGNRQGCAWVALKGEPGLPTQDQADGPGTIADYLALGFHDAGAGVMLLGLETEEYMRALALAHGHHETAASIRPPTRDCAYRHTTELAITRNTTIDPAEPAETYAPVLLDEEARFTLMQGLASAAAAATAASQGRPSTHAALARECSNMLSELCLGKPRRGDARRAQALLRTVTEQCTPTAPTGGAALWTALDDLVESILA